MSQQIQPPAPESATPPTAPDAVPAPPAPAQAQAGFPAQSGADFLAPAPVRTGNVGLGIVAALVAALVAAGAYGAIMNALERQFSYAAIGVGLLVGFTAAKVGGRNPVLPVVAAVFSLGAVYLGQLFFVALFIAKTAGTGLGDVIDAMGVSGINSAFQEGADAIDYLFIPLAGVVAFSVARKLNS
ncbi:hypothetical protein [Streptomyces sp. NBC_00503]|uniref:hypothetical protein n=1 Tax=Streptomyces sp. NBC_00503 TaxID=2903659 RepID=UPI002E811A29|nr:hypothetical protein [Streptomyces sp. NBC_00503]WUD83142.1 hypothetical protein OG490_22725 [Streptomyces sp. NBC_00503]